MLRTIAFLSLSLLLPSSALAGDYDGVWVFSDIPESGYFLINQSNDTLLVISAHLEMDGWDAFIGNLGQSNAARLKTLVSQDGDKADITVSFTSPTTAQIVVNSCDQCELPLATSMPFRKIF